MVGNENGNGRVSPDVNEVVALTAFDLRIHPIEPKGKEPLLDDWPTRATTDEKKIRSWRAQRPACNFGIACGKESGVFVVDIDPKSNGDKSWQALVDEHGVPETWSVRTGSGGLHLFFAYPTNKSIFNSSNKVAKGIDIRGQNGQVVCPPSIHPSGTPYAWINHPSSMPLAKAPAWLLKLIEDDSTEEYATPGGPIDPGTRNNSIYHYALVLAKQGAEKAFIVSSTRTWLAEQGREMADDVMKTIDSAIKKAKKQDDDSIKCLDEKPIPTAAYVEALRVLGYQFKMLELDQTIEVNGKPLSDPIMSEIRCALRDAGYFRVNIAQDAYISNALLNQYHPIKDYIEATVWDGEDHLAALSTYFTDVDGVFGKWLRKWMVGAVARVYENGAQNRVLVLDGDQDIGKSYFTKWLASGVDVKYHNESIIDPDSKDDEIRKMNTWIWEIGELPATTAKAERNALKNFLTKEHVKQRPAYGRNDINRPALSSWIATANNDGGFLNDATGSRRFMVCELTRIDHDYATKVNVNQLWAQAKALYDSGEPWRLVGEDKVEAEAINERFEMENPVLNWIDECVYTTEDPNDVLSSTEILLVLRSYKGARDSDSKLVGQIGSWMKKNNVKSKKIWRVSVKGRTQVRVWPGVRLYDDAAQAEAVVQGKYEAV